MMVLLSPQKRWRNKDRNTWCFFPHHKKCFCDYKTEGCRKQRLLVESISRLEYFNKQYQKLRESVKGKIDLSLQRFYKQNERYIRQFEEKLRRRENVKTKRQKRMLEISSYIDKIKNERRLEKIENYRKIAESAEKDEHERKLNHERHKEKLNQKRKKELEFVSPKKVTPILPPLVENDVSKEPERIDIIKEDPVLIDVTEEKSELEEEIEEEEENFSLPSIEVKMKDQKISALEKLRKIRTEKTTENAKPKRATKKKKINRLPPLTSMKNKLRLALGNREKITPKERVSITPEAESPQSKKSRRRRRKKHSSKKKHKDKTVVESTTNNNVETLREEQKPPTPPLEIEKPPETPKTPPPPPPPDYLEVDLGKEHFVQQIVLEQKDKNKKSTQRQRKCSFTMSYSIDGSDWFNYNDPVGNIFNFRDDGKKAFSIHVLDEGLATRYIRVHPTKNKNRFQINETLLGVELKQDENTKNGRRRRPKRTKRIMDTAIDENLMNRSPKPPTPPLSPPPPPSPPTPDIVENESESESSEGDFDDFEDDLIVRRSSLSTDDGSLSEKSKKADRKTSIFSLNDIQEDIEKEELLRRLKEEEEEKRLEEEHQRLLKRNRLLAEKRHQIKKQLQQKRRNQLSSNQKEKQGKDEDGSHFDEQTAQLNFFDKYCLYTQEQLQWYQAIYDDIERFEIGSKVDCLPIEASLDGLNIINKSLVTDSDYQYIFRVLETFDIDVIKGVNFRLFSLIAAFSERVKSLRHYFNITGENFNYPEIIPCLSKAKELYKILLKNKETSHAIDVEDFLIEMQAAHLAEQNILRYILQNEKMEMIDFLDYLTYFPLFLYSHETILEDLI
eukprot:TCONS_00049971-protein